MLLSPMEKYIWQQFTKHLNRGLHSPFGMQVLILGFFVLFLTSFSPPYFLWTPEPFGEYDSWEDAPVSFTISEEGFIDNLAGFRRAELQEVLVEDAEGNLVKTIQPKKRDKTVTHIIKSGENLSKIAQKYGLKVSTLLWGNKLTAKQKLVPGQKLLIPPADGVFYIVELGDTLSEIAKIHDIDMVKIFTYNDIGDGSKLKIGETVFLPEAKKTFVRHDAIATIPSYQTKTKMPSIGFRMKRPTTGTLTQGVRPGHTAIDISNKLNTPIYASQDGKIITSKGGWNYGYGDYIIIDHGNNIHTLYAHLNVRKVSTGGVVKKGEIIGLMGNSGRVFGPTGIHLHYEVRINGRKVNPNHYF